MKDNYFTASGFGVFLLIFSFIFPSHGQVASFGDTAVKTYNESWDVICKAHFAPDAKRWNSIQKDNEKKIASCANVKEFVNFMNGLFHELGQSHIVLLPPEDIRYKTAIKKITENTGKKESAAANAPSQKKAGTPDMPPGEAGVLPLLADGRICVGRIFKNSAAEDACMKQGEEIVKINSFAFDCDASASADAPWELIAHKMLSGKAGTEIVVRTKNLSGIESEYKFKLKPSGSRWVQLGAMPRFAGFFYHEILPGNIGYVYFNSFFPDEITSFNRLLFKEFKDVNGIIIDLRNNPGGVGFMAPALAGWLSGRSLSFGDMQTRDIPLKLISNPQAAAFRGPLAVLINKGTVSTAEIFAAGIQDNKRGRVFGETSSGQCLLSYFHLLSTGYRLQTVCGDFVRVNGSRIEKKGTSPNVEAKNTRESLSSGHDLQLDGAVKYIEDRLKRRAGG